MNQSQQSIVGAQPPAVIDTDQLLSRCMGNIEFAQRIVAKFEGRFASELAELESAVSAQDALRVAQIAHRVKGSSANVAAESLCEVMFELEQLGRAGDLSQAPSKLKEARHQWSRFNDCAATLNWSSAAGAGF